MKKIIRYILAFIHKNITGVEPPAGFLASLGILFFLLLTGTIFYAHIEKWSYLDALYFSVITLATVGYGDLHPTSPASKIFTIFYIFIGVGLASYVVYTFSKSMMSGRDRQIKRMEDLVKILGEELELADKSKKNP